MNDLLREAIADAKAVRTTALANAKLALEEAFTPKLQSMISAKIREEAEYDDVDEMREDEHELEAEGMRGYEEGGVLDTDEGMREDEHEMEEDMEDHNEMREDEHEMDEMEDGGVLDADEGMREDDEFELESIIKELEDEIEEDEHEMRENAEVPAEEDGAAVSENNDASSGIGGSDNKQPAPAANADSTDDPEGTGAKVVAESEDGMEGESETLDNLHEEEGDELEEGEDIDLEEVIRSLREEEEELEENSYEARSMKLTY